jgi:hypothetical protein
MSDQQAPQNGDTPAVAGPTEAPGTQEQPQVPEGYIPEKRYSDLQSEYTRTAQERAELRQWREMAEMAFTTDDPDTQRQALQRLGYDVPEEVEDVEPAEYEDPYETLTQRLERLERQNEEAQTQAQDRQAFEFLTGHVTQESERLGLDQLNDKAREWILSRAMHLAVPAPPGAPHDEIPDLEAALSEWHDLMDQEQKSWASTKQRAPYVPPGGLPANEVPNPGTGHEARMDRARRALAEQEMQ